MPYIIFVLTPYLITTFTGNVNNFNVIYLLTRGDPAVVGDSAGKTDLLITWLYKLTVDNNDYNLGAVIGIMTFVVLAVVSLITYRSSGSYKNEVGIPVSNATKAQTKASEAYVEAIDKRVDSELAESHNAQRQSFWKDQKSRRILGDVLTYVLLTVLGIIWLLPIVWIFL